MIIPAGRGRAFATRRPTHHPQRAQTGRSIPQPIPVPNSRPLGQSGRSRIYCTCIFSGMTNASPKKLMAERALPMPKRCKRKTWAAEQNLSSHFSPLASRLSSWLRDGTACLSSCWPWRGEAASSDSPARARYLW